MNSDQPSLGARAFEHVRALAQEIGPRPAGSDAERRAFDYIENRLRDWGYDVQRLPAPSTPLPRFFPYHIFSGLALTLGSWAVGTFPLAALALPLLFLALPEILRWDVRRRPLTSQSENLIAYSPSSVESVQSVDTLLLCAHADSARVFAVRNRTWLWLQGLGLFIAMRVSFAAAILGTLLLVGIPVPGVLLAAMGAAGVLAGGWLALAETLNQLMHRNRYSPGANDNASGVGVVLTLAEHFAAHPPEHVRLGFLFTGAEETGLHGAASFAATLDPAKTAVLNFDMVGAGHRLGYVARDGTLFGLKTDEGLNALVCAACPNAEGLHYTMRSSDAAAFLRHKIPATGLQTLGSPEAGLAYHTLNDTLAIVQPAALDLATRTALEIIRSIRSIR